MTKEDNLRSQPISGFMLGSGKSVMPPVFGGKGAYEINALLKSEIRECAVVSAMG